MMKEKSLWPLPSDIGDKKNATNLIKTSILLTLCKLAEYVERVHESGRFLGLGVRYKSLAKWAKANENPGRYDAQSPSHSATQGSHQSKVPSFSVPPYEGYALKGGVYIINVMNAFTSAGQGQFLTNVAFCYTNKEWSGAFASRLRQSIADSPIMSFLTMQMNKEVSCAVVWAHI